LIPETVTSGPHGGVSEDHVESPYLRSPAVRCTLLFLARAVSEEAQGRVGLLLRPAEMQTAPAWCQCRQRGTLPVFLYLAAMRQECLCP